MLSLIKTFLTAVKEHKKIVRIAGAVLVIFALVAVVNYYFNQPRLSKKVEATVVKNYKNKLQEEPFNGELLLKTARHIYYFTRNRLQKDSELSGRKNLVETALSCYRRLEGNPEWQLRVKDYFFSAYLYFQLGKIYSSEVRGGYNSRALELALRAYESGFRSPELIALLANLYFEKGDYETAISYYETLGQTRDPVLLLNKARSLLGRGEKEDLKRADELLQTAHRLIEPRREANSRVFKNIQLSRIKVAIKTKRLNQAHRLLQNFADGQDKPEYQVLYARYLLARGREKEARRILSELAGGDNPYPRAVKLLREISS
ncbi:MAG: hypothetical protein ACQEP7_00145 [bacterium]